MVWGGGVGREQARGGGGQINAGKTFFSSPPFFFPFFPPLPSLFLFLSFLGARAHGKGVSQKVASGVGLKSRFRCYFLK